MNGCPRCSKNARPSSNGISRAHERVVGGDARAPSAPRSPRGRPASAAAAARSRSRSRPSMAGPMPSFVPGNRSMHRLGHDVGGRMAHRVERVRLRSGIEQLVRRAPLGRDEARAPPRPLRGTVDVACLLAHVTLHESEDLSSIDRTRGLVTSRGSTRLRGSSPAASIDVRRALGAALTGGSRAGSPAARGWCCRIGSPPRLSAAAAALWGPGVRRCPARRVRYDPASRRRPDGMVGDTGLEPVTSCMSSKCSNQLS